MLPSLRKRNNGCQAVIGQRVAALIAEQDGHRLAENAGKHFRMQLFGQLPVTAAGQLREQCMCISFPLQKVTDAAFPAPIRRGEGRAVFHMFTQVQIIGQIFFQNRISYLRRREDWTVDSPWDSYQAARASYIAKGVSNQEQRYSSVWTNCPLL